MRQWTVGGISTRNIEVICLRSYKGSDDRDGERERGIEGERERGK